jgi:hypothetical protein
MCLFMLLSHGGMLNDRWSIRSANRSHTVLPLFWIFYIPLRQIVQTIDILLQTFEVIFVAGDNVFLFFNPLSFLYHAMVFYCFLALLIIKQD